MYMLSHVMMPTCEYKCASIRHHCFMFVGNMADVPCLSLALLAFTSQVLSSLQGSCGMYIKAVAAVDVVCMPCSSVRAWHV